MCCVVLCCVVLCCVCVCACVEQQARTALDAATARLQEVKKELKGITHLTSQINIHEQGLKQSKKRLKTSEVGGSVWFLVSLCVSVCLAALLACLCFTLSHPLVHKRVLMPPSPSSPIHTSQANQQQLEEDLRTCAQRISALWPQLKEQSQALVCFKLCA